MIVNDEDTAMQRYETDTAMQRYEKIWRDEKVSTYIKTIAISGAYKYFKIEQKYHKSEEEFAVVNMEKFKQIFWGDIVSCINYADNAEKEEIKRHEELFKHFEQIWGNHEQLR